MLKIEESVKTVVPSVPPGKAFKVMILFCAAHRPVIKNAVTSIQNETQIFFINDFLMLKQHHQIVIGIAMQCTAIALVLEGNYCLIKRGNALK
jgi:hypothetical protein